MQEYLDQANDEVLAIGTIEHVDVLNSIKEVVAAPGLDLVFIGPGDLATSMGLKGRVDHPSVQSAIQTLESIILRSPVALGGVAPTPARAQEMIAKGYRAIVLGFDWSLLQQGITAALAAVRRNPTRLTKV
jgi:4-hydroxy-2-oxoheptanedioate aldolase